MAIDFPNFPNPDDEQEYQNPTTLLYYDWNPTTQAWRLRPGQEGGGGGGPLVPDPDGSEHQDGTLDERYVELTGDTMTGPLIQHLGDDMLYPEEEGDMSTVALDDTEIEFRLMGSDGQMRCGSLELDECGIERIPARIEGDGTNSFVPDYGDNIYIADAGSITDATLTSALWFSDKDGPWQSTGEDGTQPHTVVADDQGVSFMVRETYTFDSSGKTEDLDSNVVQVTNDPPPPPLYLGFVSGGPLELETRLTAGVKLYELKGSWNEVVDITSGSQTTVIDHGGVFAFESAGLTKFRFKGHGGNESTVSLQLMDTSYTGAVTDMMDAFNGLKMFDQDLDWMDTSNVNNFLRTFAGCTSFNGDVTALITGAALNCTETFDGCTSFNQSVASWDVSNAISLAYLFRGCTSFHKPLTDWDISRVQVVDGMLDGCESFDQPVMHLNFGKAQSLRQFMRNCKSFNQPVAWNTIGDGSIPDMSIQDCFQGCQRLNSSISLDLSNVHNVSQLFRDCVVLNHNSISSLDVSNVRYFGGMFDGCRAFNQPLNSWNVGNAIEMNTMFRFCVVFNQDLNSWNVSNVTIFHDMFTDANKFNGNIVSWNVSAGVEMYSMFLRANTFNKDLGPWNPKEAVNMNYMFKQAAAMTYDLSGWCVPKVTDYANFGLDSGLTTAKYPVFGTCPPRILTNPVIK